LQQFCKCEPSRLRLARADELDWKHAFLFPTI